MSSPADTKVLDALTAAVLRLLRPLVRILLRYGVPYGAFADLAKRVYVDVAAEEFRIPGRKQTTSRVAILTGLSRKDVRRVSALAMPSAQAETERYNRAARVISGWLVDPHFLDERSQPAVLPVEAEGAEASFTALVRAHAGDVPVRAVLDELARVGAVERSGDGRVRLRARAYVPSTTETGKLDILGTDVAALTATIDHNLTHEPAEAFFQRKVAYDNLPAECLPELRTAAAGSGQKLLEELNERMAARDRDVNPEAGGTGRKRVVVGVYYFEDDDDERTGEGLAPAGSAAGESSDAPEGER